jgi:predicted nucleic acid-binding protein
LIFIDSSLLIAAADEDDQFHKRAKEIIPGLQGEKFLSELIISESVTGVGARLGSKQALKVFENLIYDPSVKVVYTNKRLLERAIQIYIKYDGRLSLADAVSVRIMYDNRIRKIASFDADFDGLENVTRVH